MHMFVCAFVCVTVYNNYEFILLCTEYQQLTPCSYNYYCVCHVRHVLALHYVPAFSPICLYLLKAK